MTKLYTFIFLLLTVCVTAQDPAGIAFTSQLTGQPDNVFMHRERFSNPKIALQPDGKFVIASGRGLERVDGNLQDISYNVNFEVLGTYDPTQVLQMQTQPDGKTLLLTQHGGVDSIDGARFVRLNADGTIDSSFSHDLENVIYFQLQLDGKIVVNISQNSADILVRLNSDGSIDTSFNFTQQAMASQKFLVLQSGKIIVNAIYNDYMQILRLNPDGSLDTSHYIDQTAQNNLQVAALLEMPDGRVLIGGGIGEYNGSSCENIMMLNQNGTLNTSFNFNTDPESIPVPGVVDFALQSDGKILVAFGSGLYAQNVNEYFGSIVRLNQDGSIDGSFELIMDNTPTAVTILPSQDIIVQTQGLPTEGQAQVDGVAKFSPNGIRDLSFNIGQGFSGIVRAMVAQSDGKIILGGDFQYFNGVPFNKLIRLNTDGSHDESFSVSATILSGVYSLAIQPDGKIIAGGAFGYSGLPHDGLIRLNTDGSTDASFIPPVTRTALTVALQPDGKILVGGNFSVTHQNRTYKSMVRLNPNGSLDTAFFDPTDNTVGFNLSVTTIVLQPDGKILVGGSFTGFYLCFVCNGMNRIVRLNSDGTRDMSFFDSNFNNTVHSIALENDGDILVGGDFNVSPVPGQKKLVRLFPNGIVKTDFTYYSGVTKAIIVQPDNKIIVGGTISGINNDSVKNIARIDPYNILDVDFNPGRGFNGEVTQMAISPTGEILIAGNFTTYNGVPARRFVALNGDDFYNVTGMSRFDINNNGCTETDLPVPFLEVVASNGNVFIPNITGQYDLSLGAGSHTLTPVVEHPAYFNISPPVVNVEFPLQAAPFNQDFCISKTGIYNDLEVVVLPLDEASPGFDAKYRVVYKNKGTEVASGSITFTFDGSVSDMIITTPPAASTTENTVTWNFFDLDPFESRMVDVTLNYNTPQETPALIGGENLSFTVSINSSQDQTPADNTFALAQTVVNAFDPNDKTCLQGNLVGVETVGDYVHYMIRFENLGNGNARNIYIIDDIDTSKFDISTLTPLNGSYLFTTKIYDGNRVKFLFENINLPFIEGANQGYVAFKIKTVSTLEIGDTFSNSAAIYFDYNAPVITNNEVTSIGVLAVPENNAVAGFSIYPNPVKDVLNFSGVEAPEKLVFYNISGQTIMTVVNARGNSSIDVAHLPAGVYLVKCEAGATISTLKFIKI